MSSFAERKSDFAKRLFDIGAVKVEGEYRLKLHEKNPDAPLSPIFMNLRDKENPKPGPLEAEDYVVAAKLLCDLAELGGYEFDAVCGIPNAGEPFVDAMIAVWKTRNRNVLRLKLVKVDYSDGTRKIIAPDKHNLPSGTRVLLVDEIITKADTKREAVQAIRQVDLVIVALILMIDRMQGGTQELKATENVDTVAVYRISEMLDQYVSQGDISANRAEFILDYLKKN